MVGTLAADKVLGLLSADLQADGAPLTPPQTVRVRNALVTALMGGIATTVAMVDAGENLDAMRQSDAFRFAMSKAAERSGAE